MGGLKTFQSSDFNRLSKWKKGHFKQSVSFAFLLLLCSPQVWGQNESAPAPVRAQPVAEEPVVQWKARDFAIPGPRGDIFDRNGVPLVLTQRIYRISLNLVAFDGMSEETLLAKTRQAATLARSIMASFSTDDHHQNPGVEYKTLSDSLIKQHHYNRRFVPLRISTVLTEAQNTYFREKIALGRENPAALQSVLGRSEVIPLDLLHSINTSMQIGRSYPQRFMLSHVLGSARRKRAQGTDSFDNDNRLYPHLFGSTGLEKFLDERLAGEEGNYRYWTDSSGRFRRDEEGRIMYQINRPISRGKDAYLSIDYHLQKAAEDALRRRVGKSQKGALAAIDTATGEVLALASWPNFDLRNYTPAVNNGRMAIDKANPTNPLGVRSYREAYPPASVFKLVTALAALRDKKVAFYHRSPDHSTRVECTPTGRYTIPGTNTSFKLPNNHNDSERGFYDVVQATMRSCNTWFTKVAMRLLEGTAGGKGMDKLFNLSKILGLGSPTGVPLQEYYAQRKDGEQDRFLYNFFMPDHNYYVENQRKFHAGETSVDLGAPYGFLSNSSIGQGSLRVTPLQMARMIGVIARGQSLPQLRMVREYREYENNVNRRGESTSTPVPVVVGQQLTNLPGMERYGNYYLDTIRWAMYQTVNGHSIKQPVGNGKTLNWPPTGTRAQPWRSASSQLKKEYPQYFSQYTFAGKTGTGQHMYVGTPNESTVAWIGGMFPCTTVNQNNIHQQAYIPTPCQGARVAVVAFYEGNPREKPVNGSSHAGPIMSDFLASKAMINHIYNNPHATARPINQNIPRSSLPTDVYREETEKIKPGKWLLQKIFGIQSGNNSSNNGSSGSQQSQNPQAANLDYPPSVQARPVNSSNSSETSPPRTLPYNSNDSTAPIFRNSQPSSSSNDSSAQQSPNENELAPIFRVKPESNQSSLQPRF